MSKKGKAPPGWRKVIKGGALKGDGYWIPKDTSFHRVPEGFLGLPAGEFVYLIRRGKKRRER